MIILIKPKGFFTYFHHSLLLDHLTDEQAGRLYKALLHYGESGAETDFNGDKTCELAFIIFREEMELNFARYTETCEKHREAGKKGGRPRKTRACEDDCDH